MIVRELITKIGFKVDATKLESANRKIGDFKKRTNAMTGDLKQMATGVRNLGLKMTAGLTLPIVGLGIAAVKASADIEMLTTDFETLLGSADRGAKMVADIRKMAARTPFGTNDLARASKTLLSFGVDAERTLPILNRIGDVASGNKERMKSLALVYGQVTANQKLMGQDLLQFINAGFNPLLEISEKTGESMKSLRERMSKGEIGIDLVREAFISATSQGGRFYKGMERGSKTLQGRLSTLKDTFLELLVAFGDMALPAMKKLTDVLISVTKWFTELSKPTKIFIASLLGIVAIAGPILLFLGQLAIALLSIKTFLAATGLTIGAILTPIGWAVVAFGALAAAGTAIYKNWEPISNFFEKIGNSISNAMKVLKYFGAEVVGVDVGFKAPETITQSGKLAYNPNITQSASSTTNKNINLNVNSKLQVPEGTPASQKEYLEKVNRDAIRKEFDSILSGSDANFAISG